MRASWQQKQWQRECWLEGDHDRGTIEDPAVSPASRECSGKADADGEHYDGGAGGDGSDDDGHSDAGLNGDVAGDDADLDGDGLKGGRPRRRQLGGQCRGGQR